MALNVRYMAEGLISRYNPWWEGDFTSPGVPRVSYLDELEGKLHKRRLVIIYGLRRSGKTTIMKQFVARLIPDTDPRHILFVSVDHPAFRRIPLEDIIDEKTKRTIPAFSQLRYYWISGAAAVILLLMASQS